MTNKYEERLGTQRILPLVLSMALPGVAAQLVNLLYSIVDRIYIGHIPDVGTDALAGIGVTSSVIIFVAAFAQIVAGGGAPLASMALGKGDRKEAGEFLGNGLFLLVVFSVITSVPAFIFMKPILSVTGASDATMPYAVDYLTIYLTGTFFVMISTGMNNFINAQGRPGVAMISVVIGALLNIILDPLFIFVFDMGVKGAALATVISQMYSAVWILTFLFSKKASLRIEMQYLKPRGKVIGKMTALGIAPFIMASTESLVGFVLNGMLEKFGDIHVSALTVMQSAMQFVGVPSAGFATGFVPVVSYNFGHGNMKRVKECFKVAMAVMFIFGFVAVLFMIIFPAFTASLFTSDTRLIETVSQYMPIFMAGMTIFGLQRTCQNMFVALGQAKISLFIALLRKVLLLVPLALILPRFMGVTGVYAGEAIADALAAICCTLIFAFKFPKIIKEKQQNS
ncbi:MAG: MATE family efflux transporter [Clostridia bacterium]|nr:MATE family efflux transporter [Clostridia bacterium]